METDWQVSICIMYMYVYSEQRVCNGWNRKRHQNTHKIKVKMYHKPVMSFGFFAVVFFFFFIQLVLVSLCTGTKLTENFEF